MIFLGRCEQAGLCCNSRNPGGAGFSTSPHFYLKLYRALRRGCSRYLKFADYLYILATSASSASLPAGRRRYERMQCSVRRRESRIFQRHGLCSARPIFVFGSLRRRRGVHRSSDGARPARAPAAFGRVLSGTSKDHVVSHVGKTTLQCPARSLYTPAGNHTLVGRRASG